MVEGAPATLEFALSSSSSPSEMAMMAVDGVHSALGMPYWMAIVAITFALRTAILPIGVLAARNSARTAKMQPEMDQLQEAIKVRMWFVRPIISGGRSKCVAKETQK